MPGVEASPDLYFLHQKVKQCKGKQAWQLMPIIPAPRQRQEDWDLKTILQEKTKVLRAEDWEDL